MTTEDKKISELYQKATSVEPSVHLDNAILSAARDAIEQPTAAKGPFSGGWPIPASMVAVVIVAVIVVPVIMQESKQNTQPERPMPATIMTEQLAAPEANSEIPTPGKLKQQQFNSMAKSRAISKKSLQSPPAYNQTANNLFMEERVEPEIPVQSTPEIYRYEKNSPVGGASTGRLNEKNDAVKIRTEKKTTAIQSLLKKERSKRVRSPESWLNYISQLITEDKLEPARVELKKFKSIYPDYTIPPELTDHIKK